MEAPTELKERANTGRREVAVKNLKSEDFRMDAVMYMLTALQLFKNVSSAKVKEITFEIALKGRAGFDINNPDSRYELNSLPGQFSALQMANHG